MSIVSTNFISSLNNYNSIAPLMAKDIIENFGRTSMAYCTSGKETKKYEATEKFIDANMSSLFWFGSIPFANKVFNKTVFKLKDLNPEVSLSYLKDGEKTQTVNNILKKIEKNELPQKILSKNGQTISVIPVLKKVQDNAKTFKSLQVSRMITSLLFATYLSAIVLPKSIIKITQFLVDKNNKKQTTKKNMKMFDSFTSFNGNKKNKDISFKSLKSTIFEKAISAQTSALDGMAAMDIAISSGRIYYVNKREKEALNGRTPKVKYAAALEKLIREAGAFYLIYFGGAHIKSLIDKVTKSKLDPIILEDKNFADEITKGLLSKNPIKTMNDSEALNFVDKNINGKNPFIKYAKKLKLIETVSDETGKVFRNPLKYLDLKRLRENFEIIEQSVLKFSDKKGLELENYVKKQAKIKRLGIYGNLISGSFAVCYVLPKIMYEFRKYYTGSNEDPGIKQILKNAQSN